MENPKSGSPSKLKEQSLTQPECSLPIPRVVLWFGERCSLACGARNVNTFLVKKSTANSSFWKIITHPSGVKSFVGNEFLPNNKLHLSAPMENKLEADRCSLPMFFGKYLVWTQQKNYNIYLIALLWDSGETGKTTADSKPHQIIQKLPRWRDCTGGM